VSAFGEAKDTSSCYASLNTSLSSKTNIPEQMTKFASNPKLYNPMLASKYTLSAERAKTIKVGKINSPAATVKTGEKSRCSNALVCRNRLATKLIIMSISVARKPLEMRQIEESSAPKLWSDFGSTAAKIPRILDAIRTISRVLSIACHSLSLLPLRAATIPENPANPINNSANMSRLSTDF
jgi:hypothetical protein